MNKAGKTQGEVVKIGHILQAHKGSAFTVELEEIDEETGQPKVIFASLAGKLRRRYMRIGMGDVVRVSITQYDLTHGRIIERIKSL